MIWVLGTNLSQVRLRLYYMRLLSERSRAFVGVAVTLRHSACSYAVFLCNLGPQYRVLFAVWRQILLFAILKFYCFEVQHIAGTMLYQLQRKRMFSPLIGALNIRFLRCFEIQRPIRSLSDMNVTLLRWQRKPAGCNRGRNVKTDTNMSTIA